MTTQAEVKHRGSSAAKPVSTSEGSAVHMVMCCSSVTEAPMSETDAAELARVMAALADPVRLRLLSIVASSTEVCSCELEAPLSKSQPTISHHTKVLSDAGLISGERRGRWMWWHANPDHLGVVRKALGG